MKLHVLIGIAIAATGVAGVYHVVSIAISLREIDLTREVEFDMLTCRRHEKDFLARKDTIYLEKHAQTYSRVVAGAKELEVATPDISILRHMESYRIAFGDIARATKEVGLTERDGLRGQLRTAIHNVEQALEGRTDLLNYVLTCRRHEKDFLIRTETAYADRFEASVDDLLRAVLKSDLAAGAQFQVPDLIVAYRQSFGSLVDRMVEVGLDEDEGLRGKMRFAVQQTEPVFKELHRLAEVDRERAFVSSVVAGLALAALLLVAIALLVSLRKKSDALGSEVSHP